MRISRGSVATSPMHSSAPERGRHFSRLNIAARVALCQAVADGVPEHLTRYLDGPPGQVMHALCADSQQACRLDEPERGKPRYKREIRQVRISTNTGG